MKPFYVLVKNDDYYEILATFEDRTLAERICELENRKSRGDYHVSIEEVKTMDEIYRKKIEGKDFYKLHVETSKYYNGAKKFPPFDHISDRSKGYLPYNAAYDEKKDDIMVRYQEETFGSYSVGFTFSFVVEKQIAYSDLAKKNGVILTKIEELFKSGSPKEEVEHWVVQNKENLLSFLQS